ncbi:LysR family transcriptional regulator [Sphingomonas sp.]|uniref:LysR family transcriptional regulator n=1 Tax=Sphingomonas sp. TaxID=28214 RepID=UPI0035C86B16
MPRININDLNAFVAIARERSFTRAAARLGVSQSALSHTMRGLESRLETRLLTRNTRGVSLTDAGRRLLETIEPHLEGITAGIEGLRDLRETPSGTIRITATDHAAETLLWPVVAALTEHFADITVEISVNYGLTDIVAEGFDAGVRVGEAIEQDMVAVRIGPDLEMAVVATPDYFSAMGVPQTPRDLVSHRCINLRLTSSRRLYAWEFEEAGRALNVRVEGPLIFDTTHLCIKAALAGRGVAFAPEDQVRDALAYGRLVRVLEDWCPPFPGYHLYYPSRRHMSSAFRLLVDSLRYTG